MSSLLVAQKYKKIKSSMLDVKAFGKIIKSLFIYPVVWINQDSINIVCRPAGDWPFSHIA